MAAALGIVLVSVGVGTALLDGPGLVTAFLGTTALVAALVVAPALVTALLVVPALVTALLVAPALVKALLVAPALMTALLVAPALLAAPALVTALLGALGLSFPTPHVSPAAASPLPAGPTSCEVARAPSSNTGDRGVWADVEGATLVWDPPPPLPAPALPNTSISSLQRASGIRASTSSASRLLMSQSSAISGASLVIPKASPISITAT